MFRPPCNDIKVIRRRATPTKLTRPRNIQALQGALIRGDVEVTLENESTVPAGYWSRVAKTHNKQKGIDKRYDIKHGAVKGRSCMKGTDDEVQKGKELGRRAWRGFKLDFVKVLGGGGIGFASLYNVTFEDDSVIQVVIKQGRNNMFDALDEASFHIRYDGSHHVVACKPLHQIAQGKILELQKRNRFARLKYTTGQAFDQSALGVVVLEFCHFGDMAALMAKLDSADAKLSTRVLWGIWECLVKLCAAVAFQPAFDVLDRSFEDELLEAETNGTFSQFIHKLKKFKTCNDVHLDQDESNILVARDRSHKYQPIFKLHDLGTFSYMMDDIWADKTYPEIEYWSRLRSISKPSRVTPEQMHEEWDELDTDIPSSQECDRFRGTNLKRGCEIAGRFGVWTNIFVMARNMEGVITYLWWMHPLTCKKYKTSDSSKRKKTYAWRLMDDQYSWVDEELRNTIMRCASEKPADRPDIISLLVACHERKRKGFNMPSSKLQSFWDKHLGNTRVNAPMPEILQPGRGPGAVRDNVRLAMADGMNFGDGREAFAGAMNLDGPLPPARGNLARRERIRQDHVRRDERTRRTDLGFDNLGVMPQEDFDEGWIRGRPQPAQWNERGGREEDELAELLEELGADDVPRGRGDRGDQRDRRGRGRDRAGRRDNRQRNEQMDALDEEFENEWADVSTAELERVVKEGRERLDRNRGDGQRRDVFFGRAAVVAEPEEIVGGVDIDVDVDSFDDDTEGERNDNHDNHEVNARALSGTGEVHTKLKQVTFDLPRKQGVDGRVRKRSGVSKIRPRVNRKRAASKAGRTRTAAIQALVQDVLPDMPVAVQNLLTRAQDLAHQITSGQVPKYAFTD